MPTSHNEGDNNPNLEADTRVVYEAVPLATAIVSETLRLEVQSVTPLIGMGSVNLILFVQTTQREIVVRLNKPQDDKDKTRSDYEKERWCIAKAKEVGIPSPEVLAVGEHSGRAFMLQNRIAGVNGKQSAVPATDLLRTLGRYARTIHSIPIDGFGDSVEGFEGGNAQAGWLRFVDYNLGELTANDPLIALGVYTASQQEKIRAAFTWLRGLPLQIGLTHCDLARRNTIVDDAGCVYLLDWGCAEINVVPHYELNSLLHWYRLDNTNLYAFLEGYGLSLIEWERLIPELKAVVLLKAFDLTRWAIDRCPERLEEISARAVQCLAMFEGREYRL